jgi:NADH-quinone oxidoreductase subunit N
MASAGKVAAFAALVRIFDVTFAGFQLDWRPVIYVLAVLTLVVGAVLAVVQTDVKRMLAYSSISHAGFILVAVDAATERGTAAALYYLMAYTFMVLGTFGIVAVLSGRHDDRTALEDLRGVGRRRPVLALALAVLLFAQAGVPPTTGFLAKFEVIGSAAATGETASYVLAVVAMLAAVVAAFLYLRVVVTMYLSGEGDSVEPSAEALAATSRRMDPAAGIAVALAVGFTVVFGIVAAPLIDFAREAVPVIILASP